MNVWMWMAVVGFGLLPFALLAGYRLGARAEKVAWISMDDHPPGATDLGADL